MRVSLVIQSCYSKLLSKAALGDHSFTYMYAAPKLWNALPLAITSVNTVTYFSIIIWFMGFVLSLASTFPAILTLNPIVMKLYALLINNLQLIILFLTVFLSEPSQEIWSCFSKIKVLQIILPHPCCSWKDRGEI